MPNPANKTKSDHVTSGLASPTNISGAEIKIATVPTTNRPLVASHHAITRIPPTISPGIPARPYTTIGNHTALNLFK